MVELFVGNDVVDLSDPRCSGKSRSQRFVARVFAPSEQALIRQSDSPDRILWMLWAAKEASFKVVSKQRSSPPPFVHAAFAVSMGTANESGATGIVSYDGDDIPFSVDLGAQWIHAVAWSDPTDARPASLTLPPEVHRAVDRLDRILPDTIDFHLLRTRFFSERERGSVHSRASAGVRIAVRKAVGELLDVAPESLEVICSGGTVGRTPPRLFHDGSVSSADVSLSHHGSLVAWAVRVPSAAAGS